MRFGLVLIGVGLVAGLMRPQGVASAIEAVNGLERLIQALKPLVWDAASLAAITIVCVHYVKKVSKHL
jgi:hypothetical protein